MQPCPPIQLRPVAGGVLVDAGSLGARGSCARPALEVDGGAGAAALSCRIGGALFGTVLWLWLLSYRPSYSMVIKSATSSGVPKAVCSIRSMLRVMATFCVDVRGKPIASGEVSALYLQRIPA